MKVKVNKAKLMAAINKRRDEAQAEITKIEKGTEAAETQEKWRKQQIAIREEGLKILKRIDWIKNVNDYGHLNTKTIINVHFELKNVDTYRQIVNNADSLLERLELFEDKILLIDENDGYLHFISQ